MRKSPWLMLGVLVFVFVSLFVFLLSSSVVSLFGGDETSRLTSKNSILKLELTGVILDGKKFLKTLAKYKKDAHIKAIVIEINSPGGVVGPSQEIYEELKRVRDEFKKPVVAVSTGLDASGAYYASVAADKIVVAPGTMIGSIGVIMEFVNLEKLYDWAHVSRYSITTGKFKDSGAEYRAMREDERALFQDLINDVFKQFKDAVATGRNLKPEIVDQYADGRVMTGAQAVKLGFADQLGTVDDAYKLAADMAGLGTDYEVFDPPKAKGSLLKMFTEEDDEASSKTQIVGQAINSLLKTQLSNRPLYLMPGVWE